jgi:hypothetical protein
VCMPYQAASFQAGSEAWLLCQLIVTSTTDHPSPVGDGLLIIASVCVPEQLCRHEEFLVAIMERVGTQAPPPQPGPIPNIFNPFT